MAWVAAVASQSLAWELLLAIGVAKKRKRDYARDHRIFKGLFIVYFGPGTRVEMGLRKADCLNCS